MVKPDSHPGSGGGQLGLFLLLAPSIHLIPGGLLLFLGGVMACSSLRLALTLEPSKKMGFGSVDFESTQLQALQISLRNQSLDVTLADVELAVLG